MGDEAGKWRAIQARRCSPTVVAVVAEAMAMVAGVSGARAHRSADPSDLSVGIGGG